jgi:hypothetical protein
MVRNQLSNTREMLSWIAQDICERGGKFAGNAVRLIIDPNFAAEIVGEHLFDQP